MQLSLAFVQREEFTKHDPIPGRDAAAFTIGTVSA